MNKYYYIENISTIYFEEEGEVFYMGMDHIGRKWKSVTSVVELASLKDSAVFPIIIFYADSLEEAVTQVKILI